MRFCLNRAVFILLLLFTFQLQAKLPEITGSEATDKLNEIMKAHATHKELSPLLVKRALSNYLDELDPTKTYFVEADISSWLDPSDALVNKVLADFKKGNFDTFASINEAMIHAIYRRHQLDKKIDLANLPKKVDTAEFKNMKWATHEEQLQSRITRLKALQVETAAKLNEELKEKSLQRIAKKQ